MQAKTIEKIINKKFDNLLESISDSSVKEVLRKNTIITGGCIVSMFLNEDINDYDLYFRTFDSAKKVAEYFVDLYLKNKKEKDKVVPKLFVESENDRIRIVVKSSGIESETADNLDYRFFEQLDPGSPQQEEFIDGLMEVIAKDSKDKNDKYKPIFITSNAITLTNDMQLILRFYGEPDDIHESYDFVHCTNYWTSWEKKLTLRKDALQSIIEKQLIYTGSLYPICSVMRLRKFINRGWSINAGQIFKICYQISKLDLDDPSVLQDQIIGVDIAYFYQLLSYLKNAEKDKRTIDYIYICELIDKIW